MTSYHRLAEVGREAGIVLCFSAAVSTRSNIQIQTCRDPGFGTEEELKQASFSCSWVESKASTALHCRKGGKLHRRYLMILFLNCTSQYPQGRKTGMLEGDGGAEIQTIEISASPLSCLLFLGSHCSALVGQGETSQVQPCKSLFSKCQNSLCP